MEAAAEQGWQDALERVDRIAEQLQEQADVAKRVRQKDDLVSQLQQVQDLSLLSYGHLSLPCTVPRSAVACTGCPVVAVHVLLSLHIFTCRGLISVGLDQDLSIL